MNGKKIKASKLDKRNGDHERHSRVPQGHHHYVLLDVRSSRSSIRCFRGKVDPSLTAMTNMPRMGGEPTGRPRARLRHRSLALGLVAAMVLLPACGDDDSGESATATTGSGTTSTGTSAKTAGLDTDLFLDGALAKTPTTEDCTLSDGAEATCYSLTVSGLPTDHAVGPFCPGTITDGADKGGIWFDGKAVYDLDGEFIKGLAETYDDEGWKMYDDDGNVLVTKTREEFEGAARPDVDADLQNHCVEGRLAWLENGEPIQSTVLIPTTPVAADASAAPRGNQGVTLDGVVIAASAPVDAILGAYTIAAFDDCGGHFNPNEGYHLHGAVGCSESGEASEGDTAMFGYALDGYPVHSPFTDAQLAKVDLDDCNGHATEDDGYHYHANSAKKNQVIACLKGQTAATDDDAGPGGGGPPR